MLCRGQEPIYPTVSVKHWALAEKPIKVGTKGITHWRHMLFQMAEVEVSRCLSPESLEQTRWLWSAGRMGEDPNEEPDNRGRRT